MQYSACRPAGHSVNNNSQLRYIKYRIICRPNAAYRRLNNTDGSTTLHQQHSDTQGYTEKGEPNGRQRATYEQKDIASNNGWI